MTTLWCVAVMQDFPASSAKSVRMFVSACSQWNCYSQARFSTPLLASHVCIVLKYLEVPRDPDKRKWYSHIAHTNNNYCSMHFRSRQFFAGLSVEPDYCMVDCTAVPFIEESAMMLTVQLGEMGLYSYPPPPPKYFDKSIKLWFRTGYIVNCEVEMWLSHML